MNIFTKKLTREWITQNADLVPNLTEILADAFKMPPHDFSRKVDNGEILYISIMYKLAQMWVCAFIWQVVLRKPARSK